MNKIKYNKLTPKEQRIIIDKGTEAPFTGKYDKFDKEGAYLCKRCGAKLFESDDKFHSGCGWPSFDDAIPNAVKKVKDADGIRTEILCANCGAHLGHVFTGEGYTDKNTRFCVNSISLNFDEKKSFKSAHFAGGCFWGVEYYFNKLKGVLDVKSGYMGGNIQNPTYKEICSGKTGHFETVEVEYDPNMVSFEEVAKFFFEIHDPTQANGQGPDIGSQYLSVVFYDNDKEKAIVEKLIKILEDKDLKIATKLISADGKPFYEAEDYHQDYYDKHHKVPYCHAYKKRF